ncbi:uncharacterized protein [Antedon mediterranea]|uniref:uncharacterized protein n=1 Tax=Antedon mediterranea TaxID=105859 RepID=UPI003AF97410
MREADGMDTFMLTLLIIQSHIIISSIAELVSNNKTATGSESLSNTVPPQNALDGNDVPYIEKGSCYLSDEGVNRWWRVDLEQDYEIVKVTIIAAIDDTPVQYSLHDSKVLIGNDGVDSAQNTQCGQTISFEQYNSSAIVDVLCSPPINGAYVFITSVSDRNLAICEVFVYSSEEEADQNDLPLNPRGFWPLNSIYTIHDLSGVRDYDYSASRVHFISTTGVAFADLLPVDGIPSSISIPNRGQLFQDGICTLMFDIKPEPNSVGEILFAGHINITQTNSGTQVYASEIEVTFSNHARKLRGVVFKPDVWTSIAIIQDGGGTVSLWRNGFFVSKVMFQTPDMSWSGVDIGFSGGASGNVRNMHFYDRAMTRKELMAALTIPSEETIQKQTAASLISKLYSEEEGSIFRFLKLATFASEHVTETTAVRTMYDCAIMCNRYILCNGYAYNWKSNHCVIGKEFVDETDLVVNMEWHFYNYLP